MVTHKNIPSQKDFYYLYNDHLGSLIAATKRGSTVLQEFSYDPWGRRRDAHNWNNYEVTEPTLFTRGFTGHEHIGGYGLINMNGRVYDARLGRFLSPDPYVQAPDYSQSFNRYSYCINNPLKYTDPTGEIFGTIFTFVVDFLKTVFIKGGIDPWNTSANRRAAWRDFDPTASWSKTNKAWKIDKGLFKGDFKQILSRFTWEFPHTIAGNFHGHLQNNLGNVDKVDYFDGATFLMNENANVINGDGISIGNYIYIRESNEITYTDFRDYVLNNGLYLHEYGHYLQLQSWGSWARITGDLLSLGSASWLNWRSTPNHMDIWIERDANQRAWVKYRDEMGGDARDMFTTGRYRDRRYYDGRFFRNFLTFGNGGWLLFYYFYDVTYSN